MHSGPFKGGDEAKEQQPHPHQKTAPDDQRIVVKPKIQQHIPYIEHQEGKHYWQEEPASLDPVINQQEGDQEKIAENEQNPVTGGRSNNKEHPQKDEQNKQQVLCFQCFLF